MSCHVYTIEFLVDQCWQSSRHCTEWICVLSTWIACCPPQGPMIENMYSPFINDLCELSWRSARRCSCPKTMSRTQRWWHKSSDRSSFRMVRKPIAVPSCTIKYGDSQVRRELSISLEKHTVPSAGEIHLTQAWRFKLHSTRVVF